MTRGVAAFLVALGLSAVALHAQDIVLSVTVSSADVHKGPSAVTPVIGHVPSGTAVPVLRNLGSWVRVSWPGGLDGYGYLHVTTGRLTSRNGGAAIPNATPSISRTTPAAASASASSAANHTTTTTTTAMKTPRPRRERTVIRNQQDGTAISHIVGVGGLFESTDSIGATSRAWRDDHLGVQIDFTRGTMTSPLRAGGVTSTQVEPSFLYGLFDHVSDYFWIRPYVGSGLSVRHQAFHATTPDGTSALTSTNVGFRVFAGAEATFAGAPRFALGVDAGYRRFSTPFPGFEPDRFGVSVVGQWYVK
jgi:hypothetical protein